MEIHFHASSARQRQSFKRPETAQRRKEAEKQQKGVFRALSNLHQTERLAKQRPACARRKQREKQGPFRSASREKVARFTLDGSISESSLSLSRAMRRWDPAEQGPREGVGEPVMLFQEICELSAANSIPMQAKREREQEEGATFPLFPLSISSPHLVATARSLAVLSNHANKPGRESS